MAASAKNLIIYQGKTFAQVLRWEAPPIIYKVITGITQGAPVKVTAVGHGVPPGWRVAVTGVKGMTDINAEPNNVRDNDYTPATVIDVDNVELNEINATSFKPYLSGGVLQYNTPVDMGGFTARMSIKDKIGGTELLSLTTANNGIIIDNTNKKITLSITATNTAALTWKKGVYDLELVSASGVVTALIAGSVTVSAEVTT